MIKPQFLFFTLTITIIHLNQNISIFHNKFHFRMNYHLNESIESESWIDSVATLWFNFNGNWSLANTIFEFNRYWMRFKVCVLNANDWCGQWNLQKWKKYSLAIFIAEKFWNSGENVVFYSRSVPNWPT